MNTFRVFWTNHGYYSAEEFSTLESAIEYGKSKGFEFSVWLDGDCQAAWTVFGGIRMYTGVAR